jgi:hypothetical protein
VTDAQATIVDATWASPPGSNASGFGLVNRSALTVEITLHVPSNLTITDVHVEGLDASTTSLSGQGTAVAVVAFRDPMRSWSHAMPLRLVTPEATYDVPQADATQRLSLAGNLSADGRIAGHFATNVSLDVPAPAPFPRPRDDEITEGTDVRLGLDHPPIPPRWTQNDVDLLWIVDNATSARGNGFHLTLGEGRHGYILVATNGLRAVELEESFCVVRC